MEHVYKNERPLFRIGLVISLLFWIALIGGTLGIALIYILMGFILYLFVQSSFISYIKGTAVKISQDQFPELYQQYVGCCTKLGMQKIPEIYMLNSDGLLNALATRFLRKTYVILYSDIVDALSKHERAINFYIGHELGHIKQGHIKWSSFLWPSSILPLLGTAYSRAREYTCDLHGLACCDNQLDGAFAMSVLAAGPAKWPKINLQNYAAQTSETGGFWMSYHELVSDYPWLCKRMNHILSKSSDKYSSIPRRNLFAWLLALLTPRVAVGRGGGLGILVLVAVIGILAAVAIPAYQDYTIRAKVTSVVSLGNEIATRMTPYIEKNRKLPYDLQEIGLSNDLTTPEVKSVFIGDNGLVMTLAETLPKLAGKTVVFQPYVDEGGNIKWVCDKGNLENRYLPSQCK